MAFWWVVFAFFCWADVFGGNLENVDPAFNPLTVLTPVQMAKLSAISEHDLPTGLRSLVRKARENPNAHWCCAVNTWREYVNSKSVKAYSQGMHKRTHHKRCGWWGWSRCVVHSVAYRAVTRYHTQYSSQRLKQTCPDQHVICCRGFLLVAEQCLDLIEVTKFKHDIIKLKLMGFLD